MVSQANEPVPKEDKNWSKHMIEVTYSATNRKLTFENVLGLRFELTAECFKAKDDEEAHNTMKTIACSIDILQSDEDRSRDLPAARVSYPISSGRSIGVSAT